jgi:P-type conjugative transfer protein TrbG
MFKRPSVRYGRTPAPETPYQKAAQVWDERVGLARVQASNWRLMAFGCLLLSGGLASALVWQSVRGTVTPWVVQVDRLGQAQAVAPADSSYQPTDPQIAFHLARFIEDVRGLPADGIVLRQDWLRAYDFTTDRGAAALNEYARANDPFCQSGQAADFGRGLQRHPGLAGIFSGRLDPACLRERQPECDRALDRNSHRYDRYAPRCRSSPEESAWRLRQRHQLVEGVLTVRQSRKAALAALLLSVSMVAGCTIPLKSPPQISYDDDAQPAVQLADPPKSVEIVEVPKLLPLPGQLKPLHGAKSEPESGDPRQRVEKANAAARVQPTRNGYINAVQVYPFAPGALYQVYAAPGQVTDVALQEGEQLVGSGPVAAGDTVRWIIGDTESGTGPTKRIHILVKPTRPELISNLVINTDRRTYLLELRSAEKTYMASVSWQYPEDQLIALRRQNASADAATPIVTSVDISRLRFRYAIEGNNPPWRPVSAFDDGSKVYIEMPSGIAQGEAPPLFVIGPEGDGQLVNYRVRQNYYIVDRLFAAAELRMGGEHQQTVRISRTDGRAR